MVSRGKRKGQLDKMRAGLVETMVEEAQGREEVYVKISLVWTWVRLGHGNDWPGTWKRLISGKGME